jgi:methionyl-tRNA formyltransferase
MRIIFAGTPQNAAQTLKALHDAGVEVGLVLTRTDSKVGRKGILTESPVAAMAGQLQLRVHKADTMGSPAITAILEAKADLAVVVAYGVILQQPVIELVPLGWFNVHYSLLPAYRGAAPVQHTLLNRDEISGISIFKIDSGLDTGALVSQVATKVEPGENAGDLLRRLTWLSESALLEVLPRITSELVDLVPQSAVGVSLAPKLERTRFKLHSSETAQVNEARVLAGNPEPMAYLDLISHQVAICDSNSVDSIELANELNTLPKLSVGAHNFVKRAKNVYLECAQGTWLQLAEVQPASKRVMSAMDWFNGLKFESSGK